MKQFIMLETIAMLFWLIAIPYNYAYGYEYPKIWCYVNPNSVKGHPGQSYIIQLYVFCTKQITIKWVAWQSEWMFYNPFYVAISGPATAAYNSSIQLQMVIPQAVGTQLIWINVWDISNPSFFNRTSLIVISNNPSGASFSLSIWPNHIGLNPVGFWYSNILIYSSINSPSFAVRIRNNYDNAIKVIMPDVKTTSDPSIYHIGQGTGFSERIQFQLLAKQLFGKWVLPIGNGTYQIEFVCYDENNATNELSANVIITVSGINIIGSVDAYTNMTYSVFLLIIGSFLTIFVAFEYSRARRKGRLKVEELQSPPPPPPSEQSKSSSQYYCRACGHLFWRDEYPELKVSHCQKCGASDLIRIGSAEYCNPVKPLPIRIKKVKHEEPLPPPLQPSELVKYRSQFHCNSCGHSFWVYEHRLKIPYCCECGAPNPVFVATAEQ